MAQRPLEGKPEPAPGAAGMVGWAVMARPLERQRLVRREEYERMVEAGLFRGEHVELIRGVIVRMSPQHEPHATVIQILTRLLAPALLGRADVRVRLPFAAGDYSLPEPDLALGGVRQG